MKRSRLLLSLYFVLGFLFQSCNNSYNKFETQEGLIIREKVDKAVINLDSTISSFASVVRIDHSRMAEAEGTYTPPSIVTVFSNPEVNSKLLKINQLVGIDLPYKVLCYSEPDLANVSIAYTSSEFIIKRHGLSQTDLAGYSKDINTVINSFPKNIISATKLSVVNENYGLIIKQSDFDFDSTINNLMEGIKGQGDTKIFGEIDFKKEASENNIEINPTTLILFGAPKPGGQAMNESPKLGLDAFCQKLLVFEKDGKVFIAYNDIVDFAELYYQNWTIPQRVINYRINNVFEESITKN